MLEPIKYKELAQKIADRTGKDKELIESIILDVFFDLKDRMTKFEDLRYNLKNFCVFYYRKNKLLKLLDTLDKIIDGTIILKETQFTSFPYDRNPHELRNKVLRLLGRYEKFIETKNETKQYNKEARQNKLEEHKRVFTGEHQDAISRNDS